MVSISFYIFLISFHLVYGCLEENRWCLVEAECCGGLTCNWFHCKGSKPPLQPPASKLPVYTPEDHTEDYNTEYNYDQNLPSTCRPDYDECQNSVECCSRRCEKYSPRVRGMEINICYPNIHNNPVKVRKLMEEQKIQAKKHFLNQLARENNYDTSNIHSTGEIKQTNIYNHENLIETTTFNTGHEAQTTTKKEKEQLVEDDSLEVEEKEQVTTPKPEVPNTDKVSLEEKPEELIQNQTVEINEETTTYLADLLGITQPSELKREDLFENLPTTVEVKEETTTHLAYLPGINQPTEQSKGDLVESQSAKTQVKEETTTHLAYLPGINQPPEQSREDSVESQSAKTQVKEDGTTHLVELLNTTQPPEYKKEDSVENINTTEEEETELNLNENLLSEAKTDTNTYLENVDETTTLSPKDMGNILPGMEDNDTVENDVIENSTLDVESHEDTSHHPEEPILQNKHNKPASESEEHIEYNRKLEETLNQIMNGSISYENID